MSLGIYIDGTLEVPGDEWGIALSHIGSTATFTLRCDEGEQTAEAVIVHAPTDCEVSADGETFGASVEFAAGEIADTDVTVTVKRVTVSVVNTWTGLVCSPRVAVVTTEAIPVPDTEAPVLSGTLVATAGDTQVTLSGPTATDNIGIAKWQYRIGAGAWVDIADSANGTMPSTVVGSLTNSTEYSFTVRALDAADNASDASSAATATPVAAPSYEELTVNITGQTGAGTNYQIPLQIDKTTGGSGNFNLGNNATDWPYDVRFYAADGTTELPYWRESFDANTQKVWVKVSADLGSNQSIKCRYGLGVATDVSSGDDTFIFFDDFDAFDTDKWTLEAGDVSYSNSEIILAGTTGTRGLLMGKVGFSAGSAMRSKFRSSGSTADRMDNAHAVSAGDTSSLSSCFLAFGASGTANHITTRSGKAGVYNTALGYNSSDLSSGLQYEVRWTSAAVVHFDVTAGTTERSETTETVIPAVTLYSYVREGTIVNCDCAIDWQFVRKYQATEPAFASAS